MAMPVQQVPVVGAFAMRMWRVLFPLSLGIVYASTHWPRLAFQTPDQPIDKFLHAGAFGVLTAMLWQTGWVARRWVCVLVVAAWAAFDESTQAIPGLGRAAEWNDYAADVMGIMITGFFLAASRPVPGVLAHVLHDRRRFLTLRLLDRPMSWLHIATGAILGLAVGCVGSVAIDSRFLSPRPVQAGVAGAVLGAVGGAFLMREFGVRALQRRLMPVRPCLRCGAASAGAGGAGGGAGAGGPCAHCGAASDALSWSPFAVVSGSQELRLCAPVVGQALGIVIVVGLLGPWLLATANIGVLRGVGANFNDMPLDLQRVMDITFVAAVSAWTLWRCRARIARALDASGQRCLACGYDLRAVPSEQASGVCTECGEPFVRSAAVSR